MDLVYLFTLDFLQKQKHANALFGAFWVGWHLPTLRPCSHVSKSTKRLDAQNASFSPLGQEDSNFMGHYI